MVNVRRDKIHREVDKPPDPPIMRPFFPNGPERITTRVIDAYVEECCEVMHDAYEEAARSAGWETQERSRKPWADVPEANKVTMRAAVAALLEHVESNPPR
jgi:hypothetical protein